MKFLRYLGYFTLLLLASIQTIVAQNYPVRIALRLSQPYTIGPSQWCRGMNEKLAVELSNQDSHQTVNIRLRLQVNGPSMHVDTKSRSGSLITLGPRNRSGLEEGNSRGILNLIMHFFKGQHIHLIVPILAACLKVNMKFV